MSRSSRSLIKIKFFSFIMPHFHNLIRPFPSWEIRIVSLLEINLGDNNRTDCQSERQAQNLHEIVLTLPGEILECVNNMIHINILFQGR